MDVGPFDYSQAVFKATERLKDSYRNKEGLEEIMDPEMGPDVRYVLSRNDLDLVKRYLSGPVTPAEFRELTFKLRQLQAQEIGVEEVAEKGDISEESREEAMEFHGAGEVNLSLDPQRSLINFRA